MKGLAAGDKLGAGDGAQAAPLEISSKRYNTGE